MSKGTPITASLPMPPPTAKIMRFLYSDRVTPVVHAKIRVFVEGTQTDPDSEAPYDMPEIWKTKTDGFGKIDLTNPDMAQVMTILEQQVKKAHPNKKHWEGPPVELYPDDSQYYRLPRVLVKVELVDDASGAKPEVFVLKRSTIVTQHQRPPLAEIDGNKFHEPIAYVKHLRQLYSQARKVRPLRISLKLTRCGSPAPVSAVRDILGQIMFRLGPASPDVFTTQAEMREFLGQRLVMARNLYRALKGPMGLQGGKNMPPAYEQALQIIATKTTGSAFGPVNLSRWMEAARDGLGVMRFGRLVPTESEDIAGLATIVFIVGLSAHGYLFGSLNRDSSGSNEVFDILVSTTNACSQDDFLAHCELMTP